MTDRLAIEPQIFYASIMSKSVAVDIVSDLVCPWCWLGKRNWDAAQNLAPDLKVETLWRPFQLDPTLPREGSPYRDYMKAKFSGESAARWTQMREHLEAAAPEAGIEFKFDDIPVRPNTLNAHRLMRWATGQNLQDSMAEALFGAFFSQSRDIGNNETLAEIAGEVGLDTSVVQDLLTSDRDEKAVWDEEVFYRKLGVSGVPTYIFNGQFVVSGAQSPQTLADALREAANTPTAPADSR
jgi:predicted DsbA family dithiol-disulfide isomerase